ncbi:hypothetical protein [Lacrimispora sp.]|uniref:hypothetical protein n=1 Tax=Lacrimispora sp. TaxID=2719234 RepID=UPI00345FB21A
MNKLFGFYELKSMNIPSVPWEEYTGEQLLDKELLWTVRSAVYRGNDLNLPRSVGVDYEKATDFASKLLKNLNNKGIVVFYPYFIAEKSGTLNVYLDRIIIEAVKDDLWNLVTFSDREVTIIVTENETQYNGNESFISENEQQQILKYIPEIKKTFRDELYSGKSVMLEWSYAYNCDINKQKKGDKYLIFYEARTVF